MNSGGEKQGIPGMGEDFSRSRVFSHFLALYVISHICQGVKCSGHIHKDFTARHHTVPIAHVMICLFNTKSTHQMLLILYFIHFFVVHRVESRALYLLGKHIAVDILIMKKRTLRGHPSWPCWS